MEEKRIAENFYLYQFPPRKPEHHFGYNIFALLDDATHSALLIDTAFEEHAAPVRDDLAANGYTVRQVVISHFHTDHIMGLQVLPQVAVLGSRQCTEVMDERERESFAPTDFVEDMGAITFGAFTLRFLPAPGHSPCSIYTVIDERYVHVADNIMADNDGAPILPSAEDEHVAEHIHSLEMLKDFTAYTLLLSHGKSITGEVAIVDEIEQRLKYLRAVLKSEWRISYEDAVKGCSCSFWHSAWHTPKT